MTRVDLSGNTSAEKETLVEWMANNYKAFGCNLEFVTDRSGEGTQFVKGFGGIGGILRWKVDFVELSNFEEAAALDDDSDEDKDDEDKFADPSRELPVFRRVVCPRYTDCSLMAAHR